MPNWQGGATGAASGAAAGSMFGPWGTAAGAGIGFVGGLFSGGKKKDEDTDLNATIAQLKQAGTAASARGTELGGMSQEQLGPILQILQQLTGGDPNALLAATRPERARVIDQYDTARKSIAQFSPRGGGTSAVLAQSRFDQADTSANITAEARQGAIKTSADLGTTLAGLGLNAQQLASMDLNSILQAILSKKQLDLTKRGQNMEALAGLGEALGMIAAAKYRQPKTVTGSTGGTTINRNPWAGAS